MTYFEFAKRFPDENSVIDFIVAVKYKVGMYPEVQEYAQRNISSKL